MNPKLATPFPDELTEAIAQRVAELVAQQVSTSQRTAVSPWLDIAGVASYASMTEQAVRSATKRDQLKSYRTETGRVLFRIEDVDAFLSGGAI